MQLGFVGLSHLGLLTSICLSSKGVKTIAFDKNSDLIHNLNHKKLPLYEPGLEEIFALNNFISFTHQITDLKNCDVVYVAVDIKTNDKNESDLTSVIDYIDTVIPVMKEGSSLVIHSQVNPGFSRAIVNKYKDKKINIYYQVEVLIFGQAVKRVLEPERYMVGSLDPKAEIAPAYKEILKLFHCPIFNMRYESAELAKISINLYLSASVTVTNTLSEVAEKIGADFSEISPVLRLDRRIGPYAYLEPGLGISGGNLERDLVSVINMSNTHGTESSVVQSFLKNSSYMKTWVINILHNFCKDLNIKTKIGILGLAYKKDTNSTKNSPSLELLSYLKDYDVSAFDPEVKNLSSEYSTAEIKNSADEVLKNAEVLIIMTPWDQFKDIKLTHFNGTMIIDPFRMLKEKKITVKYFTRGLSLVDVNTQN